MKVTDTKRARLLVVLALLGGLLALSPLAPATATEPSGYCPGTPLYDENFGIPLRVVVESSTSSYPWYGVSLCYGTNDPPETKVTGNYTYVHAHPQATGYDLYTGNASDSNGGLEANAHTQATPRYTVTPGSTSGGQTITVEIPVLICSGPCQPGTQPADGTSGVIVGTISQTPTSTGGSSASYGVTGLCIKVDGTTVAGNCTSRFGDAGVTTTGTSPANTSRTTGPCIAGWCGWPSYNYIGTTGNQIATVYVPGLGAVPVYGVHTCLYQKDTATPCPY